MKKLKLLGLILVIFLVSGCGKSNLSKISYKEYKDLINNKETFILEVMSSSCSACDTLKPRLNDVINEHNINVKYIDVSSLSEDDYNEFTDIIDTTSTPTIIFYENGVEESIATRLIGAVPKNKIVTKFKDMGYIK